jgi:transposase InsO family protein
MNTITHINVVTNFFHHRPSIAIHWVQLPSNIKTSLTILFDNLSIESLSSTLTLPCNKLERLQKEKSNIAEIIKIVQEKKQRQALNANITYHEVRGKILELVELIKLTDLSKLLGIPNSTLFDWKKLKRKNELSLNSLNIEKKVAISCSIPTPPHESISQIQSSTELQELKNMIERHKEKVRRKYSKSEKKLILSLVDQFGSKLVHLHTRVSYDTIARLLRQREQGYVVAPTKVKYLPVIETMRKYPGMGPMQIRDYIHRHFGKSMGVNSIRKAMEDNGWVASYSRVIKVEEEERRYEAVRKNYMWHLDFKHFYINKCKIYLLFIEDDFSRFIVGHGLYEGERIDDLLKVMSECIALHGRPEVVMSDGGSAFRSWRGVSKFTKLLEDFGIDQHIARIPRVNGKVESLNQKIEKELLNVHSFSSLNHLEDELSQWVGLYNFRRPHQGLDKLQVPADRFHAGAEKWFRNENKELEKSILGSMALLFKEFK